MNLQEFFEGSRSSAAQVDGWVGDRNIGASADHICFKCASSDEYESLRRMFESESEFVYQSIIAKRRISVIKLRSPIRTKLGEIVFLELSDQKPDGSQASGFDHVEIYPLSGTVSDLLKRLESDGTSFERIERPHHTTYDADIGGGFKIRLEDEPLVEKIKREEFR